MSRNDSSERLHNQIDSYSISPDKDRTVPLP